MSRVINIKLRDGRKLRAVKDFRDTFGYDLKRSLDKVNELLESGSVELTDSYCLNSFNLKIYETGEYFKRIFDCEFINDEVVEDYHPKMTPDQASAYDWMEGLSDEEKRKIRLIIDWECSQCVPTAS